MTVSELIEILIKLPGELPIEINNHHTGNLSYIDRVDLYDQTWGTFSLEDGDYPVVVLQTETWSTSA